MMLVVVSSYPLPASPAPAGIRPAGLAPTSTPIRMDEVKMEPNAFEKLADTLTALRADREQRKTVVVVRRKPNQGELMKSLAFAIENSAISSADACRVDLLIRQGKVPANLERALIDLRAPEVMTKAEPVAIADVRTPLSIIGEQKDTRRRLSLAHEAGAISKAHHHHLCKLLDNNKLLPADIARELAKIKLEGEAS